MKFEVECKKCGKIFFVECTEKEFNRGKYKKCCSVKCSHTRVLSQETKNKISSSLKKDKIITCKVCGKVIVNASKNKKCCSQECKHLSQIIPTLNKYFGLDISSVGTEKVFEEVYKIKVRLTKEYWEDNLTGIELGEKYNYPSPCNITGKIFKYLDIPTRSCKDTVKLNMLNGKITPQTKHLYYKQGWHTTWDNKEVYLRSSYEFDYAKKLDEEHIEYYVEHLRIKYWDSQRSEFRCAIPDFYLPLHNEIVEIKSKWTLDEVEMKDKIQEYKKLGYNVKVICDNKEMIL